MFWIKLYYKFLEWEWYDDIPVKTLFLHLLLTAGREDKEWKGIVIPRGSLATSIASLSQSTGLTVKQVRNSLKKLESTNEVQLKGTNKYTIVTISNYDTYQSEIESEGEQKANKGQTKGKQRATSIECKSEEKKEIVSKDTTKKEFAPRVHLLEKEYNTLVTKYGEEDTRWMIDKLSAYKTSKNKTYSSDYGAINSWVVDRLAEEKNKQQNQRTTEVYTNDKYWP